MNLNPELHCPRCEVIRQETEKDKAEASSQLTELRAVRWEALGSASAFLEDPRRNWNEDGRPVPSDYLHMAAFLSGETDE